MDGLDYWRLVDELNVIQAAFLMAGHDPSDYPDLHTQSPETLPKGYEASKTAIYTALRKGEIKGSYVRVAPFHDYDAFEASRVNVPSLRAWLEKRGVRSGFFFQNGSATAVYLDSSHPRYAPKLAAAVKAWLAMEDEPLRGRSPKKALTDWLLLNAAEFGLNRGGQKKNGTAVEEIAKVANWKPGGGAPKTPD